MPRIMLDCDPTATPRTAAERRLEADAFFALADKGYKLRGIETSNTNLRVIYVALFPFNTSEKQLDIPLTKAEYGELISGQEEKASSRIVAAIRSSV